MSRPDMPDPLREGATKRAAIEHVIVPRATDLGGIKVKRALPAAERQMVGPFIFFDEFGPGEFLRGTGLDIRPHPHIGLSTVTYLFDGEIMHRDSLGSEQAIRPGEINLMTAGRGIVHSERTPDALREDGSRLYGIQTWMALPRASEEGDPAFVHFGATDLPVVEGEGKRIVIAMGESFGSRSHVPAPTATFYADAQMMANASLALEADYEERAVYVSAGSIAIDDETFDAGRLVVLRPGAEIVLRASAPSRLLLFGGEPMDGPRFIWWNFVASRRDLMLSAADAWEKGQMPKVPGDEKEFIPMKR